MRLKDCNRIGAATLVALVAICLFALYFYGINDNSGLKPATIANISADTIGLLVCTVIFASVLLDQRTNKGSVLFLSILALESLLLFWDIIEWGVDGKTDLMLIIQISNYYVYGLVIAIILTYWVYLCDLFNEQKAIMRKFSYLIYSVAAIDIVLLLSNPWTHFYFYIDAATAEYFRGDYFIISVLLMLVVAFVGGYCILRYESRIRRMLSLFSYVLLPVGATVLQYFFFGISVQYTSMLFAIVLMYSNIYIDRSSELIHNETEMTEQRAAVMVSQIQPHFLYNSLSSIMNIKGNSEEVVESLEDFGCYLRYNLDSITRTNPVPFSMEVEQLEKYISLRKLKFGDKLDIKMDLRDTAFFIPPMTLKTIMEIAIKYNLDNDAAHVEIRMSTYAQGNDHILLLIDNLGTVERRHDLSEEDSYRIDSLYSRIVSTVGGKAAIEKDADGRDLIKLVFPGSKRSAS